MSDQKKQEENYILEGEDEDVEIRTMEKDIARFKGDGENKTVEKKPVPKKPADKGETKERGLKENPDEIEREKKIDLLVKELEGGSIKEPEKKEVDLFRLEVKEDLEEALTNEIEAVIDDEKIDTEKEFLVSLSVVPENGGKVKGDGFYSRGSRPRVSAESSKEFEFDRWLEGEITISENSEYSFELTRDIHLIAKFKEKKRVDSTEEPEKVEEYLEETLTEGIKSTTGEDMTQIEFEDEEVLRQREIKKREEEEQRIKEAQLREQEEEEEERQQRQQQEEEKRAEEKRKEDSEETITKRISELEAEKEEISSAKKALESKKKELMEEKDSLQSSLAEILKKEAEIEKKEREVEKRAKERRENKEAKKELWAWQEKRKLVEKERWEWDEKIFKISGIIKEVEMDYERVEEIERENQRALDEVLFNLKKIELERELKELVDKLAELSIIEKNQKRRLEEIKKEREGFEYSIGKIDDKIRELNELKKEIEEREAEESDPLLKKKIEGERWSIEDEIKTLEEKRWAEEEKLKEVIENEIGAGKDCSKIELEMSGIRKKIDEIDTFLERDFGSIIDKKKEKEEKESEIVIVERYIRQNSTDPEGDIKRAQQDHSFFKYILSQAKQS